LRDLDNDFASGARTTAIFLGARPGQGGNARVPLGVPVFAYAVLAGLVTTGLLPLLRNDLGYGPAARAATLAAVGVLDLAALLLLSTIGRPGRPLWNLSFRLQMFVVLVTLPVVFVPYVSAGTRLAILLLLAVSLLPLEWTYVIARRIGSRLFFSE
jgi:hypothetical protein